MKSILRPYYYLRKWIEIKPLYNYNFRRFVKFSSKNDTEESLIGSLTMAIHGIEKGLTMGDFRAGFGRDRLLNALQNAEEYINKYGLDNIQIHHIAKVVNDYKLYHEAIGYKLDDTVSQRINHFLSHFDCTDESDIQINCTKGSYFSENHADFAEFSKSRHSCRDFDDSPIDMAKIDAAVKMAQSAPSACNRQPARVYVLESKQKIADVLSLHGGNRGFTQKIDKLIMICGYIPCYHTTERDCVYTDCGIFAMNLLYALHYNEIGACILNWSMTPAKDKKCRQMVPVPEEEVICSLIACGNVPETFKVCNSGKKNLESIIHHIV